MGQIFVETATAATKDFRDPMRVKHASTSSSDFENAPADARMLEQRYAMYAPKIIRGGGGAGDGGDCIDTGSIKHRGSKRASTFQEVFIAFMKRSSRILVDNPTDGHCGIHCLQEFLRPFSAMPSYLRTISRGRSEMAQALRNNRDSLLACSFYSITCEDIYLRSGIHEVAMDGEPCTGDYWVETIDLIAWSLETKKKVCVITDSDHEVMVYSGISQPECKSSTSTKSSSK